MNKMRLKDIHYLRPKNTTIPSHTRDAYCLENVGVSTSHNPLRKPRKGRMNAKWHQLKNRDYEFCT
jgi:hypothetical protein